MKTRREKILDLIKTEPGLTDRKITNKIDGITADQQSTNQICNKLNTSGIIIRKRRFDGKLGNYPINDNKINMENIDKSLVGNRDNNLVVSEDQIKQYLQKWLSRDDWRVSIKWGQEKGIDIEALKGDNKWIIEVKGEAESQQAMTNNFINVLGEIVQRMFDNTNKYSVAFPDNKVYRGLWSRLPDEAKQRTHITALFVDYSGNVQELG